MSFWSPAEWPWLPGHRLPHCRDATLGQADPNPVSIGQLSLLGCFKSSSWLFVLGVVGIDFGLGFLHLQ